MKNIYGLIGHPVKHSLSAVMHNAAFKALGMEAEYQLFDKTREELENLLIKIRNPASEIRGLNVTVPHKVAMHDLLKDTLSSNAAKIGAVNTILIEDRGTYKELLGENTDGIGFMESLANDLNFSLEDKVVFVLGAGGAARAVIMSLGNAPEMIYFTDIEDRRAVQLEADYKKHFDKGRLHRVAAKDKTDCVLISDLLVNATTLGMKETDDLPVPAEALHKNMSIFDLVYKPKETKLLKLARQRQLHATNGLGMLLYQGAAAFRLWTNKEPPIDVMRQALMDAIG